MIRAYAEEYVAGAQGVLGEAVDFAVMTLGLEPDDFGRAFAMSGISKQFGSGNPRYVAGMNGCELARLVLVETGVCFTDADDALFLEKSPEYWAGWALAFYQWYSGFTFAEILAAMPLGDVIAMHDIYHEMDIMQFVDAMQDAMREANPQTRLRIRRETCGVSQAALAADSGVPLRQIQLFEQRRRDINRAAAETVLQLSRALHCRMEDLLERL